MNEFKVRKGLIVQGSGSNIFDVQGSQGQLFSVTDSLVGSLFSVNDISGIPIMEVFSDNTIKMGTFNQEAIIVSGSRTGMGTAFPQAELHISGANNDSLFRIQSPASASIMFVSGSGNVGIGTETPTEKISIDNGNVGFTRGFGISWDSDTEWVKRAAASDQLQLATQNTVRLNIGSTQGQLVAIGLGTTAASAQFQVRGGGATSATTALRVENSSAAARLTILDDGTSAFNTNHLYVSSSGNVGIGTASPTTKLHVTGITRIDESGNVAFYAGNYIRVFSDQNLNIRDISGNTKANISVNGSSYFNGGNVGIGTTTPTASLHISGTVATDNLMRVQSTTGAEYFFISASGNVGIGTTSPSSRLEVTHNSSGVAKFEKTSGAVGTIVEIRGNTDDKLLSFWRAGVERAYIDIVSGNLTIGANNKDINLIPGTGNVAIGTTSPTSRLQVKGSGATSATTALRVENSSAAARLTILDDGTSAFNTSHLYVSGSGRVGIGTATPIAQLHVTNSMLVNGTSDYFGGIGTTVPIQMFAGAANNGIAFRTDNFYLYPYGNNTSLIYGWNGNAAWTLRNLNTSSFQIFNNSPTNAVMLTVSSSGNVGIGTATPTTTLNVNGTTLLQGGQTTVRGSGATSATTALRVENSNQDPEFIVLDNGNVGISTATPSDLLTINSPSNTGSLRLTHLSEIETLRATSFHSGLYIGNNIYYNGSGDPITNSSYAVDSGSNNRGGNLLLMRANNGTTALGGFYFYTAPSSSIANTTATLNESFRIIPSSSFFTNTRVGIGAAANTSYAFDVASSAPNAGAARINGNSTVWVFDQASQVTRGTTSLARMFLVQMGPVNASSGTQTALTISQSINQSSTAGYTTLVVNANETGTGSGNKLLQAWQFNGTDRTVINNSGSLGIGIATPSASLHISGANNANLLRVSSPSASSALFISGSGNVGVGTATPAGLIDIFQGGNSRILVTTDNGFVGLQQSSPAERIHITSDPVNGKYLQIDAGQTSNAPRQVVDSPATAIIGYAAGDSTVYLSEPRWWMEIKLDGNIVLIPCYQPDV